MNLDSIKNRIGSFLSSDKHFPVIVDFSNQEELSEFVEYFNVGNTEIVPAEKYCEKDECLKIEELTNAINENGGNIILVGVSAFLKLLGEKVLKSTLKNLISQNTNGHIVIVTFQCKNYLKFSDTRFAERGQILVADGEVQSLPEICLISPELSVAFPNCYTGFEKIGVAIEKDHRGIYYVATNIKKVAFGKSLFNILQLSNGFDILCNKDSRTKNLPSRFGTPEQWNYALSIMGTGDWTTLIESQFGTIGNLSENVSHYLEFSNEKKWLYFIALSLFSASKKPYLQRAVYESANYKEFEKSLYRSLLTIDHSDVDFQQLYAERKEILKSFADSLTEVVDYCKVISVKEEQSIYYLTDLTLPEKEKIIDWLDLYGSNYSASQLKEILTIVYPDLAKYLMNYRHKNALLDSYFEQYKYQKVINKLLPSFEVVVEEQATEMGFVDALKPRTAIVDQLDMENSHTYFFDALGIEYLSFIQEKCNQYGLTANIMCGRCELPSLTSYNKEFVSVCQSKNSPVSDIKSLDEIKHHGEDSFDYEKVKKPVYLIRELEIIDDLLLKIKANLNSSLYEKAIIISDHGASRLAVLHDSEVLWKMASSGVHSGRCCPVNELNSKPDNAIEAEGFWVLSNYDRFQGGRKANVEVHGGASLEEVAVPVIEITKKRGNIESFLLKDYKTITLSAKEFPVVKIFVGIKSNNISVRMEGIYYDAIPCDEEYLYEVSLTNCSKKGKHVFEIMNGSDVLSSNNEIEIKKKGLDEVSLFD